jgi:hypothetical protein
MRQNATDRSRRRTSSSVGGTRGEKKEPTLQQVIEACLRQAEESGGERGE